MKLLDGFKWFLNPVWIMDNFLTLWGGGDPPSNPTSTTYTSNIPEYAKPFYEQSMYETAKNVFNTDASGGVTGIKPMPTYTGERVAGFTPGQVNVQRDIAGLTQPGGFANATRGLDVGQTLGLGAGTSGLYSALGYRPSTISGGTFTPAAAKYYADPYQQAVTDIGLREARRQGDIAKSDLAMGAIKRGTQGGARNALMLAEQERNLQQNLADIQTKGSQAGFQSAQQQYNADMARALQAQTSNVGAEQAAAQLQSQIGLGGLTSGLEASRQQAITAAASQTANLERLKTQASSEQEKQALQQKINDIQYQTAMEQRDWEKKQLEFYNAQLYGRPALQTTNVQYGPQQSPLAGLGLGLSGLSLMKGLG